MRYAISSDFHGNYQAMQKVIKTGKRFNVDKNIFLGDYVNYGLMAGEDDCLDLLRDKEGIAIKGNHEELTLMIADLSKGKKISQISYLNLNMLRQLPENITLGDIYLLSHSGTYQKDIKIKTENDARKEFAHMSPYLQGEFLGHCHTPSLYLFNGSVKSVEPIGKHKLDHKFIAIPGSCNAEKKEPRIIIFDSDKRELEFILL